jgi:hypothetical protein
MEKPMTLQARMVYYKVLGVSIAVVDQGKIAMLKHSKPSTSGAK